MDYDQQLILYLAHDERVNLAFLCISHTHTWSKQSMRGCRSVLWSDSCAHISTCELFAGKQQKLQALNLIDFRNFQSLIGLLGSPLNQRRFKDWEIASIWYSGSVIGFVNKKGSHSLLCLDIELAHLGK